MPRMSPWDAREMLARISACNQCDSLRGFHALPSQAVEDVIAEADAYGYRKPKNANGSRARYFHALLVRTAARASPYRTAARKDA